MSSPIIRQIMAISIKMKNLKEDIDDISQILESLEKNIEEADWSGATDKDIKGADFKGSDAYKGTMVPHDFLTIVKEIISHSEHNRITIAEIMEQMKERRNETGCGRQRTRNLIQTAIENGDILSSRGAKNTIILFLPSQIATAAIERAPVILGKERKSIPKEEVSGYVDDWGTEGGG